MTGYSKVETLAVREAALADAEAIRALLKTNGLGADNILTPQTRYWCAANGDELVGSVGLELGEGAALLRSAVVLPSWRGHGVGNLLVRAAIAGAQEAGCHSVFLFSTGAGPYWQRHGFREIPVPELVAALTDAPQVRRYHELGWLPTEIAWRLDLDER
jgi:N-acetylglutamate synthase-like GNAT family acetyltransferase